MASKYKQRTENGRHNPGISQDERDSVSEETKALINKGLVSLVNNFDLKVLSFPSSFSNIDRKLVHSLARDYGLKSKSKGIEPNRFITVYKGVMKGSQDFLTLTPKSLDTIDGLLASNPVTIADKVSVESDTAAHSSSKPNRKSQLSGAKLLLPRTKVQRTSSFRKLLPIWHNISDIYFAIEEGRVILINGETGSGKTTQVPQLIMEFAEANNKKCQIICSMPRRIAAVTISERVAYERGESLGQTVGYQIRLESRISSKTILTYCTNGVLLRSLLGGDEWLNNVSHLIIDETHERDKLTDFTLIVLKDALAKYENLKLILMSATIDFEKYKNYFKHCPNYNDECRVVEVPGRMYEVKDIYLEHILEGIEYMSPEMRMLKEEKDARSFFQGNEAVDMSSQRSNSRAPVVSLEEQIAMMDLDCRNEMDRILGTALNTGSTEALKKLVNFMSLNKIPVNYQHPECGRTALMAAAIHSNIDAVDDVIHMDPDLSIESREGKTALMYAEEAGDSDILDWFDAYMKYCEQKRVSAATAPAADSEVSPAVQEMIDMYEKCHIKKDIDEHLIFCILKTIHDDGREGAVLVFLPGYEHIMCVKNTILQNLNAFKKMPLDIHILHSRMKSVDQKKVFNPPPPGHRKVILSTNIAETSVTINDVSFVIDCGKIKELSYNTMNGAYTLECDWISQSCAQQRRGRAGRTKEGVCFRLYTKKRYLSLKPFKIPELLREPIAELCLQAKQLAPTGTSIAEFLGKAIDPPKPDVTKNTINLLKQMEALTANEDLTNLGRHLLEIPVDPRFGKMIVYAIILRCLDPVLTIVCCLSSGEVFKLPVDPVAKANITQMRLDMSQNSLSDHMVYLNTFREWEAAVRSGRERKWCQDNFVSAAAMEMIAGTKQQILSQLKVTVSVVNQNAGNWAAVKAAITAGLYPNIARVDQQRKCLRTPNELKVAIHTSSVLKHGGGEKLSLASLPSDWVLYEESHQIRTFSNLRTCTVVSPLTVCIFAGPSQIPPPTLLEPVESNLEDHDQCEISTINIDPFINFNVDNKTAKVLQDLRTKWHSLAKRSMNQLGHPMLNQDDEKTLSAVLSVLKNEDMPLLSTNPMETNDKGKIYIPQNQSRQPYQQRSGGRGEWGFEGRRVPPRNWRKEPSPSWEGNFHEGPHRGRGTVPQNNWHSDQTRGAGRGFVPSYPNREYQQYPSLGRGAGRGFVPSDPNQEYQQYPSLGRGAGRGFVTYGADQGYYSQANKQKPAHERGAGRGFVTYGADQGYYSQANKQKPAHERGNLHSRGKSSGGRGQIFGQTDGENDVHSFNRHDSAGDEWKNKPGSQTRGIPRGRARGGPWGFTRGGYPVQPAGSSQDQSRYEQKDFTDRVEELKQSAAQAVLFTALTNKPSQTSNETTNVSSPQKETSADTIHKKHASQSSSQGAIVPSTSPSQPPQEDNQENHDKLQPAKDLESSSQGPIVPSALPSQPPQEDNKENHDKLQPAKDLESSSRGPIVPSSSPSQPPREDNQENHDKLQPAKGHESSSQGPIMPSALPSQPPREDNQENHDKLQHAKDLESSSQGPIVPSALPSQPPREDNQENYDKLQPAKDLGNLHSRGKSSGGRGQIFGQTDGENDVHSFNRHDSAGDEWKNKPGSQTRGIPRGRARGGPWGFTRGGYPVQPAGSSQDQSRYEQKDFTDRVEELKQSAAQAVLFTALTNKPSQTSNETTNVSSPQKETSADTIHKKHASQSLSQGAIVPSTSPSQPPREDNQENHDKLQPAKDLESSSQGAIVPSTSPSQPPREDNQENHDKLQPAKDLESSRQEAIVPSALPSQPPQEDNKETHDKLQPAKDLESLSQGPIVPSALPSQPPREDNQENYDKLQPAKDLGNLHSRGKSSGGRGQIFGQTDGENDVHSFNRHDSAGDEWKNKPGSQTRGIPRGRARGGPWGFTRGGYPVQPAGSSQDQSRYEQKDFTDRVEELKQSAAQAVLFTALTNKPSQTSNETTNVSSPQKETSADTIHKKHASQSSSQGAIVPSTSPSQSSQEENQETHDKLQPAKDLESSSQGAIVPSTSPSQSSREENQETHDKLQPAKDLENSSRGAIVPSASLSQLPQEDNKENYDKLQPAKNLVRKQFRFFIITKGNKKLINASYELGLWPVTEETWNKLREAYKYTDYMYLIFQSIPENPQLISFQGYGKVLHPSKPIIKLPGQTPDLTRLLKVEWKVKETMVIDVSSHEMWTPLLDTSDGGELDDYVANALVLTWDKRYEKRTGQKRSRY